MNLLLDIDIKHLPEPIRYGEKIMLIGSCFTEHIGNALRSLKFDILQNPHGILFGPDSVHRVVSSLVSGKTYTANDLFYLQETYSSWQHHSRFSHSEAELALQRMNNAQEEASAFLRKANWLIITLGSAFSYRLTEQAALAGEQPGNGVANCHRAPATWFNKTLLTAPEVSALLHQTADAIRKINPSLRIIYTISPVRHIRDGVVENNRSKARLIEAVHQYVQSDVKSYYFPAYELVIDVLRDYRFYDIDLVHPNYAATEFVLEKFKQNCIDPGAADLMAEIKKIVTARKHQAFHPGTEAHRKFLASHYDKTRLLLEQYPFLDLKDELRYFSEKDLL